MISNNKNSENFPKSENSLPISGFQNIYISVFLLFQNYYSITHHTSIVTWFNHEVPIKIISFWNFQFSVSIFVIALQQMQILVGCQQTPFHWNMLLNEANPLQCIDSLHDWTSKPHNSLLLDYFFLSFIWAYILSQLFCVTYILVGGSMSILREI